MNVLCEVQDIRVFPVSVYPYVTRNSNLAHQLIQNTQAGMLSLSSG